jgi:16S rRNA A1518/A1519 N6-dimethyltransferase RsmA/KsgA/DIM1 with predicted DNA glycosylase/AP lyase activity
MILLGLLVAVMLVCFAGVLFFGAPYLPTLRPQIATALELANLKPNQTLLELGCGDGRVLVAAAKRDLHVVGYELNPLLFIVAWLRTRRYRKQVRVVWGNFWHEPWPPADAIFTFLLPRYMKKLDRRCRLVSHKPFKLVSFAFEIPGKNPEKLKSGVFLYEYR